MKKKRLRPVALQSGAKNSLITSTCKLRFSALLNHRLPPFSSIFLAKILLLQSRRAAPIIC
ncbi:MAG: hypothetical protein JSS37_04965 [Proteobacteria bacterium]|nr:hypothetical protein [Pseudomonadota bacterium]HNB02596.1 hypothetical protein [Nitrosomonas sp.]